MQRRRFIEDKREAIRLDRQLGTSTAAIASDLGINASLLGRWQRERDESGGQSVANNTASVSPAELERMRRGLVNIKMERGILKRRSGSSLSNPSEVRLYRSASPCLVNANDLAVSLGFPPAVFTMAEATGKRQSPSQCRAAF